MPRRPESIKLSHVSRDGLSGSMQPGAGTVLFWGRRTGEGAGKGDCQDELLPEVSLYVMHACVAPRPLRGLFIFIPSPVSLARYAGHLIHLSRHLALDPPIGSARDTPNTPTRSPHDGQHEPAVPGPGPRQPGPQPRLPPAHGRARPAPAPAAHDRRAAAPSAWWAAAAADGRVE